ncbi:selenide, water dikinase [Desulfoferula mesophila]|uniref:Selenide, water dikinase n=1 Tax=Desulfoferula mesophila TaxID=3058419 RepID=A0AAU9EI13_9BACT|nr:selenide, water dikinase [Desulfoferula mesophilus]
MVGLGTADDAGVFRLTDEIALIQTLDFFTPIVNDPYLFGRIAAVNALSDVYAMGGRPLTAMNICCFPVKDLPVETFREILRGGMDAVHEAGAVLAGGHSVEDPELKYGLSVTGVVHPQKIVTNSGLKAGQALVLTKPLGTGVIATALKAGLASPAALEQAVAVMTALNAPAAEVMAACGVSGATDITGFGLMGHALELAQGSGVGVEIEAARVPFIPEAYDMASMGLVPLGSHANKNFCASKVITRGEAQEITLDLLADAQTSGGMLMGLDPDQVERALALLAERGIVGAVVGRTVAENPGTITVVF